MRATIVIAIGFGVVACGGAAEEAARRDSIEEPGEPTPTPPPPASEGPKATRTPERVATGVDSNAVPSVPAGVSCKETVLEAACATSHEHLAKALEVCFETKGDLGGYHAEERCTDEAGFKKARVTCCYGGVVSKKPGALPVVAPTTTPGGFGGGSSSGQCPGAMISGSDYAVERAVMCAKSGLELVSIVVTDRCTDGTVRTTGESCSALVTPGGP